MRYVLGECNNPSCPRQHSCPFCQGSECGAQDPGKNILEFHLNKLGKPRGVQELSKIRAFERRDTERAPASSSRNHFRDQRRNRNYSRSRSPRCSTLVIKKGDGKADGEHDHQSRDSGDGSALA